MGVMRSGWGMRGSRGMRGGNGAASPTPHMGEGCERFVLARQGDGQHHHHHVHVNVWATARARVHIRALVSEPACPCTSVHGSGTQEAVRARRH